MRKDIPTSRSCKAIGTPSFNSVSIRPLSNLKSALVSSNGSCFFRIIRRDAATLIPCDSTVARAAPSAPIPNTATNSRSNAILTKHAIITVTIGVLESPMPLNMLPRTLYPTINTMPKPHILTYETV